MQLDLTDFELNVLMDLVSLELQRQKQFNKELQEIADKRGCDLPKDDSTIKILALYEKLRKQAMK